MLNALQMLIHVFKKSKSTYLVDIGLIL